MRHLAKKFRHLRSNIPHTEIVDNGDKVILYICIFGFICEYSHKEQLQLNTLN